MSESSSGFGGERAVASALNRRGGVRIPLFVRLFFGMLVVLALVLVPTFVLLRDQIREKVRGAIARELAAQATVLAGQLGAAEPAALSPTVDEIVRRGGRITRATSRAGGVEGGMSTGQPIRLRAAMKPFSSVPAPLATVDLATGEDAVAIKHGPTTCIGDLFGQMPISDCSTPAAPMSWGAVKAQYR